MGVEAVPVIVQPNPEDRKRDLLEKQKRIRDRRKRLEEQKQKRAGVQKKSVRQGSKETLPGIAVNTMLRNAVMVPSKVRYTFSAAEIEKFYFHNKSFQAVMNTGDYFYYDNHLVLMTKDAFSMKNGRLVLNKELPDFEKKYCVQCKEERISHVANSQARLEDGQVANIPLKAYIVATKFIHATEHTTITGKIKSEFTDFLMLFQGTGYGGDPPFDTFGGTLSMYMELENITNEYMCELTEISTRTIQRYRNNQGDPELPYVVAICIALKLLPSLSIRMVELAGYTFRGTKRDVAYLFLLNTEYKNGDVARCNNILTKLDLKPLTKKCS